VDQNRPVCWSIVVKEIPTVGSIFFGAFSGRVPKATKDVNIRLCIRRFTVRNELVIVPANSVNFLRLLRS
jgi:hypothetical protein